MSIEDERACEALVIAYSHLIDMGEAERVHELFTDDALWESPELRLDGRAAIERGFVARQARADRRSRHICTNIAISVALDAREAAGLTYFQLYRDDGDGDGPRPIEGQPVIAAALDPARVLGDAVVVDGLVEDLAQPHIGLGRDGRPPLSDQRGVPGAHEVGGEVAEVNGAEGGHVR